MKYNAFLGANRLATGIQQWTRCIAVGTSRLSRVSDLINTSFLRRIFIFWFIYYSNVLPSHLQWCLLLCGQQLVLLTVIYIVHLLQRLLVSNWLTCSNRYTQLYPGDDHVLKGRKTSSICVRTRLNYEVQPFAWKCASTPLKVCQRLIQRPIKNVQLWPEKSLLFYERT